MFADYYGWLVDYDWFIGCCCGNGYFIVCVFMDDCWVKYLCFWYWFGECGIGVINFVC